MMVLNGRNLPIQMIWDPIAEFERLAGEFRGTWEFPATSVELPYIDVAEEDGSVVVKAELPGVSPEEIDITVEDGVLIIKAEHSEGEKAEGSVSHYRRYCSSMTLPWHVDPEKVSATVEHDLLEVRLPKTEALETKHVEIKAQREPKPKTNEGTAHQQTESKE